MSSKGKPDVKTDPGVSVPWARRITVRTAMLSWLVAVLTIVTFASFTFPAAKRAFLGNMESKAAVMAAEIGTDAEKALSAGETAALQRHCSQLLEKDADLVYIAINHSNVRAIICRLTSVTTNVGESAIWLPGEKGGKMQVDPAGNRLVYNITLPLGNAPGGDWVCVGFSLQHYDENMSQLYSTAVFVALVCIILALVTSIYYAHRLVRPVKELRVTVQKIAGGDWAARAPMLGRDEVGELAASLNSMTETLQHTHKQLLEAKEAAESASEAKSMFLATVSHEIRTPINGVIGMLKLIKDSPLDTRQAAQVNTAITSARALLSVIEGILDFSKIEAGKIDMEKIDFELTQVVDSAVMIFMERAKEKNLWLNKDIAPDVPLWLKGDPSRISQILINLIANAMKFTSRGGVAVKITAEDITDTAVKLHFSVADTGVGIPPERQTKLFNPFTQVDNSTTRKYGGTGLGLAICKQLVELMGGQISLESKINQGTTFSFVIPFDRGSPAAVEAQQHPVAAPVAADGTAQPKASVLVVEDNNINAYVTRELLVRSGYACDVVDNGQEAVRAFSVKDYDLILMDIQMPIMDGYEATRAIRDKERHRPEQRMPIVALTANAMAGEKERCVAAGMDDYLVKPLDPELMNRTIERLLRPDRKPAHSLIGREPVNYAELLERCMKDEKLAKQLLDEFIGQARETVSELREHLAADDRKSLHHAAHRLKGTAATLACEHIRRIAFLLESMAQDPDLPKRGPALIDELEGHVRDVANWREVKKEKELLDPNAAKSTHPG